ncbi:MAG: ABC transporter permease [Saprospiraceae bacterium]|nr:ABC transporter permease [Bacteroidia bacterium]NNF22555.1 ABC transporter permease [Saprospiraceae bacterium]
MHKLWLIAKREYLVRVTKKTFIITTLLTPLGIGLLAFLSGYLAAKGGQATKTIMVKDDSGIFVDAKPESKVNVYTFSDQPLDRLIQDYKEEGYDLLIHIPEFKNTLSTKHDVSYYSTEKLSIATIENVERAIGNVFKEYKVTNSNIDREVYESFKMDIDLENGAKDASKDGEEDTSGKLSIIIGTVLGGVMGFIMYMVIFIYGGMVMRSVMEEKINRIVELMISSVKPMQLMLGKVLGVGAVGLTQLGIWLVLIPVVVIGVQMLMGGGAQDVQQLQEIANQANSAAIEEVNDFDINQIITEFGKLNWLLIIPTFVIFFFGGYFIYSSLFAAVGSAIGDDMGEGQQLMFPIILPVILAFIMMQGTLQNPNGGMAVFGSMFPLTSPIIMPARLAFDPPIWEILVSIVILVLSCLFFAWLAGRIYRVGILMYGKKVSFKELGKWIMYKS